MTPYQPGALPFVFPRAVEEGSIQATYIKPAEIVPSPYGWGWSSGTGTGRPQEAEHADVSLAAKVKDTGVRVETSPWVQCWLPTSRHGSGMQGWLPEPRLASIHPALGLVEIIGVFCHRSGVPLFALLSKELWDWQIEGTGRELGGTG